MKERIVIEKELLEKIIKASPIQWFDNKEKGKLVIFGKEYQIEKEPITWEELKELCFELPNKIEYYTYNEEELIGISGMYFWQKGRITHNIYDDGVYVYAKNRTPQQMWGIIKNLIGEE